MPRTMSGPIRVIRESAAGAFPICPPPSGELRRFRADGCHTAIPGGSPAVAPGGFCPQVRIPSSPRKRGSIRKDGKTLKRLDSRFRGNDGKGARTTQFDGFRSPARQTGFGGNAPSAAFSRGYGAFALNFAPSFLDRPGRKHPLPAVAVVAVAELRDPAGTRIEREGGGSEVEISASQGSPPPGIS
jgi:hypothetical protein